MSASERMSEPRLRELLESCPISPRVYRTLDSTNAEARRALSGGVTEPTAFFADEQTAGRGRMGRSFYSPADTGIYGTLLLPMNEVWGDPVSATARAAVAVRRAILRVTGVSTEIKWVNDLYLGTRKVCGILAESAVWDDKRFLILGVGINLCTEQFPEELCTVAGSLLASNDGLRNRLAAAMVEELWHLLTSRDGETWLDEYRAHSNVLGRAVRYVECGVETEGVAESIDKAGRLCVLCADGRRAVLASGEISLRLTDTKQKNEEK